MTFTFLTLIQTFGPAGTFLIYASLCLFTLVYVWRFTPETKGRSLEEIQSLWRR